ncbi:hypothetical protein [Lachnotalea glycerini]|uniref:DNA and RNA helicase n=1 Tax=Lachnotalea glycerini TaxID=1763509 RepID=A0A371JCM2_9FIRM|nr:hypothetical protein [Lachnotalea glycerini]RDY30438.1 hypothetical protein CG710_014670 [Lachnotalea glycerini]
MLVQAIPLFQDGHILRREMLIALSDYAFLTSQLFYKGYADGILAGCELTTTKDNIILNTGIVYFKGQAYLIKEPMAIAYYPTNTTLVLKLSISDELTEPNFIYREIDLILTEQTHLQNGEIELCRFKLQQGAKLRDQYQDFEDRNTTFDTLNRIHAPFSTKEESTLSWEITKAFAQEMLVTNHLNDLDTYFCIQILNQPNPISKAALMAYLSKSCQEPLEDRSNLAVYKELVKVLKARQSGKRIGGGKDGTKKWKVSVD